MSEALPAIRLVVLMLWTLVALRALPELWAAAWGRFGRADWGEAVLAIVAIPVIVSQVRALAWPEQASSGPWVAAYLVMFATAALAGFVLVQLPRMTEAHKRAAVQSHLFTVAASIVAAALAGGGG